MALDALVPPLAQGAKIHAWVNGKTSDADNYDVRYVRGYGSAFLPRGRGEDLHAFGGAGTWNEFGYRKKYTVRGVDGKYYQFVEGFDSALTDTSIGLFESNSVDGGPSAWSELAGNPVIDETDVHATNVDQVTAPRAFFDGTTWRLFVGAQSTTGSVHRIHLFTNPDLATTGWTKYTGSGTDGAVLQEDDTPGSAKETGVNDLLPFQEPGDPNTFLRAFFSMFRLSYGWTVGYAESADSGNSWDEHWGNPVIVPQPARSGWTSTTGRTVTVSDGSVFDPDALVIIRNASTSDDWVIDRIQSIAGNVITLYHGVGGLTGTDANRLVAQLNAGSLTPHELVRIPGGGYRLFLTAFQPFILEAGSIGNCELNYSVDFASIEALKSGEYRWNHLEAPHAYPHIWGAERNNENLSFFSEAARTIGPDEWGPVVTGPVEVPPRMIAY